MDPLRCLRNFYTDNRLDEVKIVDGKVSFGKGEYEFSGDVKTNFLSSINRQPYMLAQLLLYIQNWDKPHSEYAKLALKAHTGTVYTADKQTLRAYLKGEQELAPDDAQLKRPLEEGEEEGELTVQKESPKKLRRQDIEGNLRTRENLLVLSHKDFSNCLQVYAAAEKVYTAQLKIQDGKAKSSMPAKSSRMDRTGTQSTKQQQKLDVKIYGDGAAAGIGSQKKKPPPPTPSRHSTGLKHTKGGPPMQLKQPPIIIVPESDSAIVSLFNAKELLQDGEFVPSEQTAALLAGDKKPDLLMIKRQNAAGKSVKFEIRDKVPREGSKNWERVVAIVCSGKLWQFKKGYPFSGAADGDLMDTFTHLCGFFFYYGGDDVPETVKSWNVKTLPLNRSQRHGDIQTVQTFFDTLTAFLDSRVRGRDGKYKKGQQCKPDKLAYK